MTRLVYLALAATFALGLTACTQPEQPAEPAVADTSVEAVPAGDTWLADDDDTWDCDAEDWKTRETPDCGWLRDEGGALTFVAWSWAKAGQASKPPASWTWQREYRPLIIAPTRLSGDERREPAPKPTKTTTTAKKNKR